MSSQSANRTLIAAAMMSLESLDNLTLAALNNAIQTWGQVDPGNLAYEPCKDLSLIREDGNPFDLESLQAASAAEVNRRVKAGTFK